MVPGGSLRIGGWHTKDAESPESDRTHGAILMATDPSFSKIELIDLRHLGDFVGPWEGLDGIGSIACTPAGELLITDLRGHVLRLNRDGLVSFRLELGGECSGLDGCIATVSLLHAGRLLITYGKSITITNTDGIGPGIRSIQIPMRPIQGSDLTVPD